jgi:folate-dependent phosphoribosylglycinamide formyltransferase PurN
MKRLLVVGDDKIGRTLISRVYKTKNLVVFIDASSNFKRLLKLIEKGSLKINWVAQMFFSEILRTNCVLERKVAKIYKNQDILNAISQHNPDQIYLFRAGLIVNKKVLASGVEILNVHCASIPDYGGLGAIPRALKDRAYEQKATLHRVTQSIDRGDIVATKPYLLDPTLPYRLNEDIAYNAGIELLINQLKTTE